MNSTATESEPYRLACRHCRRANPAGRRFCGGCGKSLWETCPRCGTECAAEERFCGACGADIAGSWDEERQQFTARIEQALALADQHLYSDAIDALRGVAMVSDPRLEPYAAQAIEESQRIQRRRNDELAKAQAALTRAGELMAAHAYERAQVVLEETPAPLRSVEHNDLLGRAITCRQEILALSGEIRAAVEEKRTGELLPKLERLLALKPSHAQAMQLATQLRDRLIKSAKALVAQNEYQKAADQLGQIPSVVANDELEKLRDAAGELAGLWSATKDAALADATTLTLIERLCQMSPNNAAAAKLRSQIAERAKSKPVDPRLRAPNWGPSPQRTFVGFPVDDLVRFSRIQSASDQIATTLAEHPGQFFTALGLALQAMELTAFDCHLTPQEETGVLGQLSQIRFGRKAPSAAWGIDLSDSGLKALRLTREGKSSVKVDAAEFIAHRELPSTASAEASRPDVLSQTLRSLAERMGEFKQIEVCIGLPAQRVLGRFFELPPMLSKKVADSVQYEARHQLPIELDALCWSHAILDEVAGKAGDQQPRKIMVQAAREAHVRDRLGLFKAAGIKVDCVQSDCVAVHNAISYEFFGPDESRSGHEAIAAIDVGATGTSVVISSPRHVWFRTFGRGGDDFARELMRELQLTADQAERLLREPAKARRFREWLAAIEPLIEQLGGEIQRSLATYQKQCDGHPVKQVCGIGGAFQTLGLLRYLRTGK